MSKQSLVAGLMSKDHPAANNDNLLDEAYLDLKGNSQRKIPPTSLSPDNAPGGFTLSAEMFKANILDREVTY